jgi:hypothetical protein
MKFLSPAPAGLFHCFSLCLENLQPRLCPSEQGGWSTESGHSERDANGDPARLWADRAAEIWQAPIDSMSLLGSIEAPCGGGALSEAIGRVAQGRHSGTLAPWTDHGT